MTNDHEINVTTRKHGGTSNLYGVHADMVETRGCQHAQYICLPSNEEANQSKYRKERVIIHTKKTHLPIDWWMLDCFGWELVGGLGKVSSNPGQQR